MSAIAEAKMLYREAERLYKLMDEETDPQKREMLRLMGVDAEREASACWSIAGVEWGDAEYCDPEEF